MLNGFSYLTVIRCKRFAHWTRALFLVRVSNSKCSVVPERTRPTRSDSRGRDRTANPVYVRESKEMDERTASRETCIRIRRTWRTNLRGPCFLSDPVRACARVTVYLKLVPQTSPVYYKPSSILCKLIVTNGKSVFIICKLLFGKNEF